MFVLSVLQKEQRGGNICMHTFSSSINAFSCWERNMNQMLFFSLCWQNALMKTSINLLLIKLSDETLALARSILFWKMLSSNITLAITFWFYWLNNRGTNYIIKKEGSKNVLWIVMNKHQGILYKLMALATASYLSWLQSRLLPF